MIAMAADADGRGITGILVADPDPTDGTSGRIPQLTRIQRGFRLASPEYQREQTLNEPNPRPIWPVGIDDDLPERLWPGADFPLAEDSVKDDPTTRLVSLSFLGAALKRRAWLLDPHRGRAYRRCRAVQVACRPRTSPRPPSC